MPAKPIVPAAGFDFASFQAIRPTTPLPGNNHDAENQQLRQTDQEIIDWLSDAIGANGALNNGTVTLDALAAEVLARLDAAGPGGGPFAPLVHDHDGVYALAGHTHSGGGGSGPAVDTVALLAQALAAAQAADAALLPQALLQAQAADVARNVLLPKMQGNNGNNGGHAANIFRTNSSTLSVNVTVTAGENMSCTGPLTIPAGVTLESPAGTRVHVL